MIAALIAECESLGVVLTAAGDRLNVDGSRSVVTDELVGRLRANKSGLLAVLGTEPSSDQEEPPPSLPNPAPCPTCGCPAFWQDVGGRLHCGECEPVPAAGAVGRFRHIMLPEGEEWECADENWNPVPDLDTVPPALAANHAADTWDDAVEPPEPCDTCGGIDCWWDAVDGVHCSRCEPVTPKANDRRKRAKRLRAAARQRVTNPEVRQ